MRGIIAMAGTCDGYGKPILLLSSVTEGCARLWELPAFDARGALPQVPEARAFCALPEQRLFVTGDRRGEIKIFQFAGGPPAV